MIIPYLIDAIGFWVFILFALINLALLAPIYLFYVGQLHRLDQAYFGNISLTLTETANRHLEQLDILFSGPSCLSWRAEKHFTQKMNEQAGIIGEDQEKACVEQVE